jgi:hypothetical protein
LRTLAQHAALHCLARNKAFCREDLEAPSRGYATPINPQTTPIATDASDALWPSCCAATHVKRSRIRWPERGATGGTHAPASSSGSKARAHGPCISVAHEIDRPAARTPRTQSSPPTLRKLAGEILALHLDGTCLWRHIDHMTIIDKQRIAAVRTLEAKGCVFNDPAASKAMPYTRSSSCKQMNSWVAPKARLRRRSWRQSLTPSRTTRPFAGRTARSRAGRGDPRSAGDAPWQTEIGGRPLSGVGKRDAAPKVRKLHPAARTRGAEATPRAYPAKRPQRRGLLR